MDELKFGTEVVWVLSTEDFPPQYLSVDMRTFTCEPREAKVFIDEKHAEVFSALFDSANAAKLKPGRVYISHPLTTCFKID